MTPQARQDQRPCVLSISGSDSSGGSGIQADQRTIAGLGGHMLTAVTSITAQQRQGSGRNCAVSPELLAAQIDAAQQCFRVAAIKIGQLPNPASVETVADRLRDYQGPVVLDPVFRASSGLQLVDRDVPQAIQTHLREYVDLLTPNLAEVGELLGGAPSGSDEIRAASRSLCGHGWSAVLVKGGHLPGPELVDILATVDGLREWRHRRINTQARGTGCSLASAIAVFLGQGLELDKAVDYATRHLSLALRHSYRPGASSEAMLPWVSAGNI